MLMQNLQVGNVLCLTGWHKGTGQLKVFCVDRVAQRYWSLDRGQTRRPPTRSCWMVFPFQPPSYRVASYVVSPQVRGLCSRCCMNEYLAVSVDSGGYVYMDTSSLCALVAAWLGASQRSSIEQVCQGVNCKVL